jgi:hypothetical protein
MAWTPKSQVEQHRCRHDWDDATAEREADTTLFQELHYTRRGIEPKCRASGQQHRVHFFNEVAWPKEIRLSCPGRSAPNIHSTHRAIRAQHDCAAGRGA